MRKLYSNCVVLSITLARPDTILLLVREITRMIKGIKSHNIKSVMCQMSITSIDININCNLLSNVFYIHLFVDWFTKFILEPSNQNEKVS